MYSTSKTTPVCSRSSAKARDEINYLRHRTTSTSRLNGLRARPRAPLVECFAGEALDADRVADAPRASRHRCRAGSVCGVDVPGAEQTTAAPMMRSDV